MSEVKLGPNTLVGLGLRPDGSEVVDSSPRVISFRGPIKSAEVKLKEMMERELERRARREETELDGYDFELEEDETVMLHPSVEVNPMSAREIRKAYHEQKVRKAKQKAANDAAAEGTKGPPGNPASPAKNGKLAQSKESASASSTAGADSEED